MESSSELVFVTGGTGYVGSHILLELLKVGYRVRAAARGAKIQQLRELYAKYGAQFEVISVADVAIDEFPAAFKGATAVIHSAAPLPSRNDAQEVLRGAIEGTLNVVRQADKAGIKKIVVTSTIATARNPSGSTTDQDWNPVTKEQAYGLTGMAVYGAAKTVAERELWAYADAHPHLDITTINPPFIYGPVAETFKVPEPSIGSITSLGMLYALLFPDSTMFPPNVHYADVRDVAKAHVRALKAPPSSSVGRKRLIFGSPYEFDLEAVRNLVVQKRPQVASRWTTKKVPTYPSLKLHCDMGRLKEVLGMDEAQFISLEDTMLDSIDSLLAIEQNWIDTHGYRPELPSVVTADMPKTPGIQ
ncbi:NAD(P)-binding protein [Hymenopellis radicata]|nr:NAD(P)-binding protein [Hymenopellis radicata]